MCPSNDVNARQPTYDAIIKKTFTKIDDRPTRKNKDNLLVEVKQFLVGVSAPSFDWASRYGLLAETRGGQAYQTMSGMVYRDPDKEEPQEICPKIKKKWSVVKREQKRAEYSNYKTACYTRF